MTRTTPHSRRQRTMPEPDTLSIQLYTVRRQLAEDLDGTIAALAAIGLRQVEAFDLPAYGHRLREPLRRHGLRAPSAHVDLLAADAGDVVATARELGVTTVIQPWTDPKRWQDATQIAELADALGDVARSLAADGLRVGYHNHHFELASRVDDRHALEIFAERLDPSVVLEVDAYWAHAGGADVPALLRTLGDRVVALHVKDGDGSLDTSRQVAAGQGVVPIPAILEAAPQAVPIIELDDTAGDMLDAVRASFAYLTGLTDASRAGRAGIA
jgi:sugar phosphate isomerase/epimerase